MVYHNKQMTLLMGLFVLILLVNSAGAVNRIVPTNYASITAAYSAASAGDTILVNSGTYNERLVLSKRVTLQGVDTGSGVPIIDGSGAGNVITLNSNNCTVDGFVIRNAGTYRIGIQVSSDSNTISNNYISNNNVGINVMGHNNNHILNNVISSNMDGIQIHTGSSDNEISGNAVTYNNRNGIMLSYSAHNNTISDNDASHNGQTTLGDGISLYLCNGCTISGNTASSNRQSGIYILQGNNNTVTGNTANGNTRSGIDLGYTSDNTISGNTITGNTYRGFEINSASGNTFFTNILSNSVNAYSTSSDNDWNSTTSMSWTYGGRTLTGLLGNVWSDYSGLDCDGDGLGDTSHNIAGGSEKDHHPIARVQSNPRLEVRKIANKTSADVGEWIKYTIWVNNTGNVSLTSVKAWDNLTSATWNVGTLTSGQNYSSTATYQVKVSDMPGPLINKLFANGTNPCGGETNNSSIAVVSLTRTCSGIPRTITVCASGCDHTRIQDAINAACPGDTILVDSGTYYENVIVNKTLTLMGVDTGSGLPVVYGSGSGDVVTISADGCTLQGFVMKNSGHHCSGISVASNGNTISNNTVNSNSYGISLASSTDNIISENTANNDDNGIYLRSSTNNTISGNTANNDDIGIYLRSSTNNTISDNTAIANYQGIYLYFTSDNTISDNTANINHYGINLYSSAGNTISDNTANRNHYGINLYSSAGNTISGNTATGSYNYGILLDSSSSNTLYLNAFSNTNNARSNGNNYWNSTSALTSMYNGRSVTGLLGNIWSDYNGFDCDKDGIGDTPYRIAGGSDEDYHPLGGKVCSGELQAKKLADRSGAQVGDWINYTIWINNTGNVNLTGVRAEDNLTSAFWNVGNLTPGQNFNTTTRHQVILSDLPGPLINGLSANGTDPCGLDVNNSSVESVDIVYSPKITVSKTANLSEGAPSTIVSFKIEVNNTGNANFTSVDVKDVLPLGLDYISDNSGLTASQDGRNYTWIFGRLNSSQSFAFNLTARINGKKFGLLSNSVNVTGHPEYGRQVNSSATASITASQAGITVTKSADHSSGSEGALINFTMIVTNNGSALLQHVFVSDKLPSGLAYNSSSAGGICSGQYINWTDIGPLASGASQTLWVRGKIDGSVYGPLTNQVDVTGRPEHGDEVRSSATSTVESLKASMMITKSVTPTSGSKGALINFTMIVTNNGSALLQHVFACAQLPSGLTYDSSSIVSGGVGPNGYCTDIGPLASGESATLWIKAEIDGSAYGTLSGQGTVTGQPQYGNNITATVAADVLAVKANITVTKTVSPTFGSSGSLITFSLVVRNNGDAPLPQIFVSDLLPEGMRYVSSDSGVNNGRYINWSNIGPLNPGEASYPYLIFANIDGTVSGTLTNRVDVEAQPEHGANVTANATASVQARKTEITVTKIADPASGSPGTDVTFTLQIENSGDAALPHIFVSDLLPEGMSYVSSSDSGVNNSQFINWSSVGPLASGASRSLQIVASIDGPISGTKILTNRVDVVAQPEHGANVTANATASVQARKTEITVTKIADPASGSPGTDVTFTLQIENSGDAALPHIFVSDLLPEGMSYVSSSDSGVNNSQFINWSNVGPLASGASRSLQIVASIDGPISGTKILTNRVDVVAQPEHGANAIANATAAVQAEEAGITISNIADPIQGPRGTQINFTLAVTNNGTASLLHVFVSDLLPAGLTYHSSSAGGAKSGQYINWTDIGPLTGGQSSILWIEAEIDGSVYSTLTNRVDVVARPEHGESITANATADVQSRNICLSGHKFEQSSGDGLSGWNITATDSTGNATRTTTDSSGLWQICNISAGSYTVSEESRDGWIQISPKEGCYKAVLDNDSISDLDFYNDRSCNLTIKKTVDKPAAMRGEDITYTVDLSNPCNWGSFTNVTLWDILPKSVVLVSVSPDPSTSSAYNLTWDVGTLGPGQNFEATIVVRVPIVDINYDSSQTVSGTGFVNVHDDYDTHQGPESITNCAYAKADLVKTISSCASTKIVDPGTELQSRESGSGSYESEEMVRMRTENKSIRSISSVSAVHRPTTFSLPQNRSIDYGTKWTEATKGINTQTGATIDEQYTFANRIAKNRSIELDENGSTMKTEFEIEGSGHIGMLKKESPDSHPKAKPIYESSEDFVGSFKATEFVDEYGSSVQSNKSMTGYGYVSADKRVRDSQRTYESGTGSYRSDELISTPTNYMAKDIDLVHGPTNYSYTPQFNLSQNLKWSEGMWSRSGVQEGGQRQAGGSACKVSVATTSGCNDTSPPASYIGERYSSLEYLKKESIVAGLNEMSTNASFTGTAEYRVKALGDNRSTEIDNEELYAGRYNISRKVQITGVSKYDRPHISVEKKGNQTVRWFNNTNANVASYVITVTNDGNRALAPVYVRDIMPPGTEYMGSSIRPASLTKESVNWTLVHLGIGSSIQIEIDLNITDNAPANVVNRVMVCGMNGEECVSAAAYSALESDGLPCSLPQVALDKKAWLDASDPTRIHFMIEVRNNDRSSLAATLTDDLPSGLSYLGASLEPSRQQGQLLEWIVSELKPGGVWSIEYQTHASADGVYVNAVHLDASATDGSGHETADAAARVEVKSSGTAFSTVRYGGWQPPNWNLTSPDQGVSIDLSPEED